ncbi:MAG: RloB family protein [Bacteroidota bacterium]
MPRIKRSFERPEGKKEARLIIIAAEGRNTERIYFEALAEYYQSTEVHVEIIDRKTDSSNPEEVLKTLNEFATSYELDETDELWMVIDRDFKSWTEKTISEVARQCHQKKGFNLGLSNPAFEIWLLIHVKDIDEYTENEKQKFYENKKLSKSKTALKKELSKLLPNGFNESNYDPGFLIKNISIAIERARKMDKKPQSRWPDYLGTRIYRLAEKIIKGK